MVPHTGEVAMQGHMLGNNGPHCRVVALVSHRHSNNPKQRRPDMVKEGDIVIHQYKQVVGLNSSSVCELSLDFINSLDSRPCKLIFYLDPVPLLALLK